MPPPRLRHRSPRLPDRAICWRCSLPVHWPAAARQSAIGAGITTIERGAAPSDERTISLTDRRRPLPGASTRPVRDDAWLPIEDWALAARASHGTLRLTLENVSCSAVREEGSIHEILVRGGSGLLGKPTACRLKRDGYELRLLARDAARVGAEFGDKFEVVAGDVADRTNLEAAMRGCDGVHISVGGAVDQVSAENVAALAPRLGVSPIGGRFGEGRLAGLCQRRSSRSPLLRARARNVDDA